MTLSAETAAATPGPALDLRPPRPRGSGRTAPPEGPVRLAPQPGQHPVAVPRAVPVRRQHRHGFGERPDDPGATAPGAERTARRVRTGSATIRSRREDVTGVMGAAPPHRLAGARNDLARPEPAVHRPMPLGGNGGEASGQRVRRGHAPSRTERAAHSEFCPGAHDRPPRMVGALRALPPDLAPRPGGHAVGAQRPVRTRVPQAGEVRVSQGQGPRHEENQGRGATAPGRRA